MSHEDAVLEKPSTEVKSAPAQEFKQSTDSAISTQSPASHFSLAEPPCVRRELIIAD
jgi:hypothetical protein